MFIKIKSSAVVLVLFFALISLWPNFSTAQVSLLGCCKLDKTCYDVYEADNKALCTATGHSFIQDNMCDNDVCVPKEDKAVEKKLAALTYKFLVPLSQDKLEIVISGSSISEFIAAFYIFAVGVVGLLVLLMMTVGGLQWLLANGNASKISEAKDTIKNALLGLLLVVFSYFILFNVNPDLIAIKSIGSQTITKSETFEPVEFETEPSLDMTSIDMSQIPRGGNGTKCNSESSVVNAQNISDVVVSASDPRVLPKVLELLKVAGPIFKRNNATLRVGGMYRDWSTQQYLYNCSLTKKCNNGNLAAKPSCDNAPHMLGVGIDVNAFIDGVELRGLGSQSHNGGKGTPDPKKYGAAMKHLQELMGQAGFDRICAEWWHFQPRGTISKPCAPGVYVVNGVKFISP